MSYELSIGRSGVALVLGGSGGAGAEISLALARAGADVALTFNSNEEKAGQVEKNVISLGRRASAWHLDLTELDQVTKVISLVAKQHGGIHTLIYAVGPIFAWGSIGELSPVELRSVLDIETVGFHAALHAALPHLRKAGGSIVACTTWANRRMLPGDGLSAIPKSAIDSMIRQVACEEAGYNIRANVVSLGSIDVGMGSAESKRSMVKDISPEQWADLLKQIPLKRLGRGDELASAVVYLASDQASYVTGQTIIVDGGCSL